MLFFDPTYALEQAGNVLKAFLTRFLGELVVHVRPLIIFAGSGVREVVSRAGHLAAMEQLEPELGVFLSLPAVSSKIEEIWLKPSFFAAEA